MPQRTFFLILLVFILSTVDRVVTMAGAENAPSAGDRIQLLYSSRLSFGKDGVPEVGVGLIDGVDEITFQAASSFVATIYDDTPKRISYASSQPLRIRLESSRPGESTVYVVVETVARKDKADIRKLMDNWKKRGLGVSVLRVGAILALHGRVIDNVRFHLVEGAYPDENEARKRADEINRSFDENAFLFSKLTRPPEGSLSLIDSEGVVLGNSRDIILLRTGDGSPIRIVGGKPVAGNGGGGAVGRSYRGMLYVTLDRTGKLALGNWVSLETVLMGTVPAEMFSSAPMEALKAQAIAARGQLLAKLGTRHLADPYHICSSQHCQVYEGSGTERKETNAAIKATRGTFILAGEDLVDTSYSASCGGHTENNENVWHQLANPSLRGKLDATPDSRFAAGINEGNLDLFLNSPPDAYCRNSGYANNRFRWRRSLSVEKATELVNRKYPVGKVLEMKPLKRGGSGRLMDLSITGEKGEIVVHRELPIRRLLGNLPSALVKIESIRNEAGRVTQFLIRGAGFGHGVGMCQIGAIGRAKAGQNHREILKHYYGDVNFEKLY